MYRAQSSFAFHGHQLQCVVSGTQTDLNASYLKKKICPSKSSPSSSSDSWFVCRRAGVGGASVAGAADGPGWRASLPGLRSRAPHSLRTQRRRGERGRIHEIPRPAAHPRRDQRYAQDPFSQTLHSTHSEVVLLRPQLVLNCFEPYALRKPCQLSSPVDADFRYGPWPFLVVEWDDLLINFKV